MISLMTVHSTDRSRRLYVIQKNIEFVYSTAYKKCVIYIYNKTVHFAVYHLCDLVSLFHSTSQKCSRSIRFPVHNPPPQVSSRISIWVLTTSFQNLDLLLLNPFHSTLGFVFWVMMVLEGEIVLCLTQACRFCVITDQLPMISSILTRALVPSSTPCRGLTGCLVFGTYLLKL